VNRSFPGAATAGEAFLAMDRLLDNARTGPMFLRQPEIATLVVEALKFRELDLRHFRLHSYVVMSNHVHVLVTPTVPVSKLMQSLKRYTALQANRILGLTGKPFWQDESYDRVVRDAIEFQRIARYIEMNPVQAGLASTPGEFPWSSAKADLQSAAGFTTCPTSP
jgi:REP element-mobilizing transposase RayT